MKDPKQEAEHITEKQFLEALRVVNQYREQAANNLRRVDSLIDFKAQHNTYTKETLFTETDLPVRVFNAITAYGDFLFDQNRTHRSIKLGEFANVSKKDLRRVRHLGKLSIIQIEEVLSRAGVSLKN